MKVYCQTEIVAPETAVAEQRPRVLLVETAAPAPAVEAALRDIAAGLGRIVAIPAAAHEANLRALLPRDLAERGVAPGTGEGGEAVLKVVRTPSPDKDEVWTLAYEVAVR